MGTWARFTDHRVKPKLIRSQLERNNTRREPRSFLFFKDVNTLQLSGIHYETQYFTFLKNGFLHFSTTLKFAHSDTSAFCGWSFQKAADLYVAFKFGYALMFSYVMLIHLKQFHNFSWRTSTVFRSLFSNMFVLKWFSFIWIGSVLIFGKI